MIATRLASADLADDITTALGDLAAVILDPDEATALVLSGTSTVIITPPTITSNAGTVYTLEWEMPIVGAPVADQDEAWQSLDEILTRLDSLLEWDHVRPITWSGSQTATAPAYLITHKRTIYKENPNA